jgi:dTDP-4-amino-4,6-dideoxygalactose transaminase
VWHQYTVLLTDAAPVSREEFLARLTELGIGNGIYYPKLVFDYDCYRTHPQVVIEPMPVAKGVVERCVSLPVHQYLGPDDIDTIITAVRKVMAA